MDKSKMGSGAGKTTGMSRRRFLGASGTVLASGAIALALGGVPGRAAAAPLPAPLAAMTDVDLLNYALTLEHLEATFYQQGQSRFSRADFTAARALSGFGNQIVSQVYDYFNQIAEHERQHVQTLMSVIQSLGGTPVTACTYDFGYTDADGYMAVAQALENTGVMAYDGAVALIQAANLQTAAATIATVEARHAAYLNLLNGTSPFPAAFDTTKTMPEVLAIAGPFIVACEQAAMPSSGSSFKYTVQSGDNYYSIARRFGTTVDAIYQANNIPADKRNLLLIGTVLTIPGAMPNS
jgi:rubrerythrin